VINDQSFGAYHMCACVYVYMSLPELDFKNTYIHTYIRTYIHTVPVYVGACAIHM
jgi:hypothetical protein